MINMNGSGDDNVTGKPVLHVTIEGLFRPSEGVNFYAPISNKYTTITRYALVMCSMLGKMVPRNQEWDPDDDEDWPESNNRKPLGKVL